MWIWIAIGIAAVVLLAIALFRARHGWSNHRPASARNAHAEADAAAWLSKLDKGPPGTGF
jgi:hypothetical protein